MTSESLDADSIWTLLERRCELTPEALFGIDDAGRSISFASLRDRALRVAGALHERGVSEGSVVSWSLPTRFEAVILELALCRLGGVQNPILPINREREFSFIVRQAKTDLLVVPKDFRGFDYEAMSVELVRQQPDLDVLVLGEDLPERDVTSIPQMPEPEENDVRWIFYTSGTTADPKGVQHTDRTLILHAQGMADRYGITAADRIALVFPYTHIGGATWLATALSYGSTLMFVETFDPAKTIPWLSKEGVTLAGAGTAFHQAYLRAQRESPGTRLFPRVRCFPGGAAPKPPQLHEEMKREFDGAGIVSAYGLTECPLITVNATTDPDEKLARTEGRACPESARVKVVRLDGQTARPGEEGEVRLKGPQLFKGYLDAQLNDEAFDSDGFFRSGDLGFLDPEGFLTITGRLKDVIVRKGENISAKEIEDLLHGHPSVVEVAVVGLPDPKVGERCCAIIVLETDRFLTLEEVKEFLLAHQLMVQKIPEQLEVLDALPRNPSGKVLKRDLVARFGQKDEGLA